MKLILTSLLTLALFSVATPSFALIGIDAAMQCGNTPGCMGRAVEGGGIVIRGPEGGYVFCESMEAECVVIEHAERLLGPNEQPTEWSPPGSLSGSETGGGGTRGSTPFPTYGLGTSGTPQPIQ